MTPHAMSPARLDATEAHLRQTIEKAEREHQARYAGATQQISRETVARAMTTEEGEA